MLNLNLRHEHFIWGNSLGNCEEAEREAVMPLALLLKTALKLEGKGEFQRGQWQLFG